MRPGGGGKGGSGVERDECGEGGRGQEAGPKWPPDRCGDLGSHFVVSSGWRGDRIALAAAGRTDLLRPAACQVFPTSCC